MSTIIQLTGTAIAVLSGIVLIIAPWFTPISFWIKLLLAILGALMIWLGVTFSSG